jgi:uncharacterized protein (DUF1778 family)
MQTQLDLIDEEVEKNQLDSNNRSRFMRRCARKQAKRILNGKAPLYLPEEELDEDSEDVVTITVSLDPEDEELIAAACTRSNHKMSPFLVWSTLAEIDQ